MMGFVTLAYKNVVRRRFRTLLTVGGLSAAVASVVALVGIANGFARSFNDVYASHGVDIVVSRKGAADRLSSAMQESFVEKFRRIEGVERASGFLAETMSLEEIGAYGVPTIGIRFDSPLLLDYEISAGRGLQRGDRKVVLLGSQLAPRLEQRVGEKVVFFEDEEFEVVGIFESHSAWENGSMIVPLEELQRLSDRSGQITFANIVVAGRPAERDVKKVVGLIEAIDDRLAAMPTRDFVESDTRIRIASSMAWMTSSIALVIGAIGMLNTMMMSIFERTQEIGILKAVGWSRKRIVAMVLLEASLLSVAASMLGIAGGVFGTWCLSRLPYVAGIISASIDGTVVVQGLAIAIGVGLLGAAYPAYRAARLMPTESLRHG